MNSNAAKKLSDLVSDADHFYKSGQYDSSISSYKEAIDKINERIVLSYLHLASEASLEEKYEEAISHYDNAISINSKCYGAYVNKANLLAKLERYEEALLCYQEALKLNSSLFQAYHGMGSSYFGLKNYEKAIEYYNLSLNINPNCPESEKQKALVLKEMEISQNTSSEETKIDKEEYISPLLGENNNNINE